MDVRRSVAVVLVLSALVVGCSHEHGSSPPPATRTSTAPPQHGIAPIRVQLQEDPIVRNEMLLGAPSRGVFRCGMDVLGRDRVGHRMYVYLECGEYARGSHARLLSGSDVPARVTVVSTGEDLLVSGVEFPRDSAVQADVRRMFPPAVAARIRARDVDPRPTQDQLNVSLATTSASAGG